jgi:hypothetical protein
MEKRRSQIHHLLLDLGIPSPLLAMLLISIPIRRNDHARTPLHRLWLVSTRHPLHTVAKLLVTYLEVAQSEVLGSQAIAHAQVGKRAMGQEEDNQIQQPRLPIWSFPTRVV